MTAQVVIDGFKSVTVLDISKAALERVQNSIAPSLKSQIDWRVGDILASPELPPCDVWLDSAGFHFLLESDDQARYVALANRTVKQHGVLMVARSPPIGRKGAANYQSVATTVILWQAPFEMVLA